MKTGGPIRGFISRWLVRFEASQQIFQVAFLGVTAVSTLSSALNSFGHGHLAKYIVAAGAPGAFAFAYVYVESGVFNRKNRERADRGTNFAGPMFAMNQKTQARVWSAALSEALDASPDRIQNAAEDAVDDSLAEFRNGVDLDETFNGHAKSQRRGES